MHDWIIKSNLDELLFGLPMVGMLFLGYFRLDELLAAPKQRRASIRKRSVTKIDGRLVGCDPDGRPWPRQSRYKGSPERP
jgi:hypothetical protein